MQTSSLPTLTPQVPIETPKKSLNIGKMFGILLLLAGIMLIVASIFMVARILTGIQKPPQVFNIEAPTITLPTSNLTPSLPEGTKLPEGVTFSQEKTEPVKTKLIPDELFNGVVNIGLFYLLMMFIASSGVKIADIGIKLIKN